MPASASPPPSPPVRTPGQQPSHPASATNRSRTPQNDRFALYSPRNPDRRWIRAKRRRPRRDPRCRFGRGSPIPPDSGHRAAGASGGTDILGGVGVRSGHPGTHLGVQRRPLDCGADERRRLAGNPRRGDRRHQVGGAASSRDLDACRRSAAPRGSSCDHRGGGSRSSWSSRSTAVSSSALTAGSAVT